MYNLTMIRKLIIFFTVFLFSLAAYADTNLRFEGFVADNAGLLSPDTKQSINAFLLDLQKKTTAEIAVVTVNSLDGLPIEDVALKIGRDKGVGAKEKNNGAVILVSPNDRKLRIEIGYGLEGAVTDAHAGRIRDNEMLPYFKKGQYENGILRGAYTLANDIAASYGVQLAAVSSIPAPEEAPEAGIGDVIWFIFLLILFVQFRIFPLFIGGGGGYGGSGGFGGGSFGGFSGGGGFGGGGASGGW